MLPSAWIGHGIAAYCIGLTRSQTFDSCRKTAADHGRLSVGAACRSTGSAEATPTAKRRDALSRRSESASASWRITLIAPGVMLGNAKQAA